MSVDYARLPTERLNPRSGRLDRLSPLAAARLMNAEDARAVKAVSRALPAVARAVSRIAASLGKGGRLFFFGAGTSGRLGVLEAAECPPTFDTPPSLIRAVMAGGNASVFKSKEGAEDRGAEAAAFVRRALRRGDVAVGVAASGVTAFAGAALAAARRKKALTVLVTCNPRVPKSAADVVIVADTGPEVLSGSTRLKAGTATKMILNTLTTLSMVRLGKTYGNHMVDLQPRSRKLAARSLRLIKALGGVADARAAALYRASKGRVKTAVLMARKNLTAREAETLLSKSGGFLRRALSAALLLASIGVSADVRTGLDVLVDHDFAALKGKRVGVIVNGTSVDRRGRPLVDIFLERKDVTLAAIFTPEHGLSGRVEAGEMIGDTTHARGIPVYSLYGKTKRPTRDMLKGLDALVFDVQDVGARIYTYIATMGDAMEAAGEAGLAFFVLDRPNPAGGDVVEGEVLDAARHKALTAYYPIPMRHGMTVGEIARFHQAKSGGRGLTVVPMEGWRRGMVWGETGLAFRPPSPNIQTPESARLYAGLGSFESTNVDVGRGTPDAFHVIRAPWLDGPALAARLRALDLPGVAFDAEPHAVRLRVTDERTLRPVDLFIHAAWILRDLHGRDFQPRWREMPYATGSEAFETLYKSGAPAAGYLEKAHGDAARFASDRRPYLLYD